MSGVGDDLFAPGPKGGPAGKGPVGGGLTERIERGDTLGRVFPVGDRRKIRHDRLAARVADPVPWHVTKDDRMEAVEAGDRLIDIHRMFGIDRENPEVLEAFNHSLFFCHTVNSGSVLQPGRSRLVVKKTVFDFHMVVLKLGLDIRRFFRAMADEVRETNRKVIAEYDPSDPETVERYNWLMEVAFDRGLSRFPELAHDSSDKCTALTPAERAALQSSKQGVFASIVNVADSIDQGMRVPSSNAARQGTNGRETGGALAG